MLEPTLNMVSLNSRGIWMLLFQYAWTLEEPGVLAIFGRAMTIEELAAALRGTPEEMKEVIDELEQHNVFSRRASDGAIYSRRLVKDSGVCVDDANAERQKRKRLREAGKAFWYTSANAVIRAYQRKRPGFTHVNGRSVVGMKMEQEGDALWIGQNRYSAQDIRDQSFTLETA